MAKRNQAERQARLNDQTETAASESVIVNEHATTGGTSETAPKGEAKSIVPSKYAGRYKNGGSDPLAMFIKQVCGEGDKFEYSAFFDLCRKNGIAETQVAKYEGQVAEKAQGANGRARMTLRNMLAPIARKNGGLVNLAGDKVEFELAKPAASGAAAKAQETAATGTAPGEDSTPATDPAGSEAGSETEETQTE